MCHKRLTDDEIANFLLVGDLSDIEELDEGFVVNVDNLDEVLELMTEEIEDIQEIQPPNNPLPDVQELVFLQETENDNDLEYDWSNIPLGDSNWTNNTWTTSYPTCTSSLPDPPIENLSPLQYFKFFVDDNIFQNFVEQTNYYSCQFFINMCHKRLTDDEIANFLLVGDLSDIEELDEGFVVNVDNLDEVLELMTEEIEDIQEIQPPHNPLPDVQELVFLEETENDNDLEYDWSNIPLGDSNWTNNTWTTSYPTCTSSLPDPPIENLSPLQYFKFFVDDNIFQNFVEQTNYYSCQFFINMCHKRLTDDEIANFLLVGDLSDIEELDEGFVVNVDNLDEVLELMTEEIEDIQEIQPPHNPLPDVQELVFLQETENDNDLEYDWSNIPLGDSNWTNNTWTTSYPTCTSSLPDPPIENLSPLQYFKFFVDDNIFQNFVEQTNYYSCQFFINMCHKRLTDDEIANFLLVGDLSDIEELDEGFVVNVDNLDEVLELMTEEIEDIQEIQPPHNPLPDVQELVFLQETENDNDLEYDWSNIPLGDSNWTNNTWTTSYPTCTSSLPDPPIENLSPLQYFKFFVDDNIFQNFVEQTNYYSCQFFINMCHKRLTDDEIANFLLVGDLSDIEELDEGFVVNVDNLDEVLELMTEEIEDIQEIQPPNNPLPDVQELVFLQETENDNDLEYDWSNIPLGDSNWTNNTWTTSYPTCTSSLPDPPIENLSPLQYFKFFVDDNIFQNFVEQTNYYSCQFFINMCHKRLTDDEIANFLLVGDLSDIEELDEGFVVNVDNLDEVLELMTEEIEDIQEIQPPHNPLPDVQELVFLQETENDNDLEYDWSNIPLGDSNWTNNTWTTSYPTCTSSLPDPPIENLSPLQYFKFFVDDNIFQNFVEQTNYYSCQFFINMCHKRLTDDEIANFLLVGDLSDIEELDEGFVVNVDNLDEVLELMTEEIEDIQEIQPPHNPLPDVQELVFLQETENDNDLEYDWSNIPLGDSNWTNNTWTTSYPTCTSSLPDPPIENLSPLQYFKFFVDDNIFQNFVEQTNYYSCQFFINMCHKRLTDDEIANFLLVGDLSDIEELDEGFVVNVDNLDEVLELMTEEIEDIQEIQPPHNPLPDVQELVFLQETENDNDLEYDWSNIPLGDSNWTNNTWTTSYPTCTSSLPDPPIENLSPLQYFKFFVDDNIFQNFVEQTNYYSCQFFINMCHKRLTDDEIANFLLVGDLSDIEELDEGFVVNVDNLDEVLELMTEEIEDIQEIQPPNNPLPDVQELVFLQETKNDNDLEYDWSNIPLGDSNWTNNTWTTSYPTCTSSLPDPPIENLSPLQYFKFFFFINMCHKRLTDDEIANFLLVGDLSDIEELDEGFVVNVDNLDEVLELMTEEIEDIQEIQPPNNPLPDVQELVFLQETKNDNDLEYDWSNIPLGDSNWTNNTWTTSYPTCTSSLPDPPIENLSPLQYFKFFFFINMCHKRLTDDEIANFLLVGDLSDIEELDEGFVVNVDNLDEVLELMTEEIEDIQEIQPPHNPLPDVQELVFLEETENDNDLEYDWSNIPLGDSNWTNNTWTTSYPTCTSSLPDPPIENLSPLQYFKFFVDDNIFQNFVEQTNYYSCQFFINMCHKRLTDDEIANFLLVGDLSDIEELDEGFVVNVDNLDEVLELMTEEIEDIQEIQPPNNPLPDVQELVFLQETKNDNDLEYDWSNIPLGDSNWTNNTWTTSYPTCTSSLPDPPIENLSPLQYFKFFFFINMCHKRLTDDEIANFLLVGDLSDIEELDEGFVVNVDNLDEVLELMTEEIEDIQEIQPPHNPLPDVQELVFLEETENDNDLEYDWSNIPLGDSNWTNNTWTTSYPTCTSSLPDPPIENLSPLQYFKFFVDDNIFQNFVEQTNYYSCQFFINMCHKRLTDDEIANFLLVGDLSDIEELDEGFVVNVDNLDEVLELMTEEIEDIQEIQPPHNPLPDVQELVFLEETENDNDLEYDWSNIPLGDSNWTNNTWTTSYPTCTSSLPDPPIENLSPLQYFKFFVDDNIFQNFVEQTNYYSCQFFINMCHKRLTDDEIANFLLVGDLSDIEELDEGFVVNVDNLDEVLELMTEEIEDIQEIQPPNNPLPDVQELVFLQETKNDNDLEYDWSNIPLGDSNWTNNTWTTSYPTCTSSLPDPPIENLSPLQYFKFFFFINMCHKRLTDDEIANFLLVGDLSDIEELDEGFVVNVDNLDEVLELMTEEIEDIQEIQPPNNPLPDVQELVFLQETKNDNDLEYDWSNIPLGDSNWTNNTWTTSYPTCTSSLPDPPIENLSPLQYFKFFFFINMCHKRLTDDEIANFLLVGDLSDIEELDEGFVVNVDNLDEVLELMTEEIEDIQEIQPPHNPLPDVQELVFLEETENDNDLEYDWSNIPLGDSNWTNNTWTTSYPTCTSSLPDPPIENLSPLQYFKFFVDDNIFQNFVEQTNYYSCQFFINMCHKRLTDDEIANFLLVGDLSDIEELDEGFVVNVDNLDEVLELMTEEIEDIQEIQPPHNPLPDVQELVFLQETENDNDLEYDWSNIPLGDSNWTNNTWTTSYPTCTSSLPDPPIENLSPLQYFKFFVDDNIFQNFVEQTNYYSCQFFINMCHKRLTDDEIANFLLVGDLSDIEELDEGFVVNVDNLDEVLELMTEEIEDIQEIQPPNNPLPDVQELVFLQETENDNDLEYDWSNIPLGDSNWTNNTWTTSYPTCTSSLPDPPIENLSPLQYFKFFVDDNIFQNFVEQTNYYSCQVIGSSINTNI
ncbi:hypothetical protein QTP88_001066 [Uroleucon formosanum]